MRFAFLAALVAIAVSPLADASQTDANVAPIADGCGAWTELSSLGEGVFGCSACGVNYDFAMSKDGVKGAFYLDNTLSLTTLSDHPNNFNIGSLPGTAETWYLSRVANGDVRLAAVLYTYASRSTFKTQAAEMVTAEAAAVDAEETSAAVEESLQAAGIVASGDSTASGGTTSTPPPPSPPPWLVASDYEASGPRTVAPSLISALAVAALQA